MKRPNILPVLLPLSLLALLASYAPSTSASGSGGADRYRAFIDTSPDCSNVGYGCSYGVTLLRK